MVRDAAEHAEEDKARRAATESRNEADALVYQGERLLKDLDDKLSDEEKAEVTARIESVKEALGGEDAGAVDSTKGQLAEVLQRIGTKAYEATDSGDGNGTDGGDGTPTRSRRRRPPMAAGGRGRDDRGRVQGSLSLAHRDTGAGRLPGLAAGLGRSQTRFVAAVSDSAAPTLGLGAHRAALRRQRDLRRALGAGLRGRGRLRARLAARLEGVHRLDHEEEDRHRNEDEAISALRKRP